MGYARLLVRCLPVIMRSQIAKVYASRAYLYQAVIGAGLVCGITSFASADTIRVGLVTKHALSSPADIMVSGDDFSFGAIISPQANFGQSIMCDPCIPGSTLSLDGLATGVDVLGSVTIGEVSFNFGSLSPGFGYAEVRSFGSVVLPQAVGQTRSVSAPVQLTVSAQTPFPFETFSFSGQGVATLSLARKDAGPHEFRVTSFEFRFEEAAPTPEPATIMLLGTGLIVAAGQRRRRQKRAEPE